MMKIALVTILYFCFVTDILANDEQDAKIFMEELDANYTRECNIEMNARWAYLTDIENKDLEYKAKEAAAKYLQFQRDSAKRVKDYDYHSFSSADLYRKFRFLKDRGPGGLDQGELSQYETIQTRLDHIYKGATVCRYQTAVCAEMNLHPDIINIFATSRNPDELRYYWEEWRSATGSLMRDDYLTFVQLSNKAARLDNYFDTGDSWLNAYTVTEKERIGYSPYQLKVINQSNFKNIIKNLWAEVFEMYEKLHAFVRAKLKKTYPDLIDPMGLIPSYLLGDMWARDWTNIADLVMPFPDEPKYDVTNSMLEHNWDPMKLFIEAEKYFERLDLFKMTPIFWKESVIDHITWGKKIDCEPSSYDFCLGPNSEDFRIKMCTEINMEQLIRTHREMAIVEYFMLYRNKDHVFRNGANPGFLDAFGEMITLSVSTPKHLESLGLTFEGGPRSTTDREKYSESERRSLNFLMRKALEKLPLLSFSYIMDIYRWNVFKGDTDKYTLNADWWMLRKEQQGLAPPSGNRGEEYFDAGAEYHVPANIPYIQNFVSLILQFQFHRASCRNFNEPLHNCDLAFDLDALEKEADALSEGFSKPWPLILEQLTKSYTMDPSAITDYFKPLMQYLDEELEKEYVGWGDKIRLPKTDEDALENLDKMEQNLTEYVQNAIQASWEYNTDVNSATESDMNEASAEASMMYNMWWKEVIQNYSYEDITTPWVKRQYELQQSIGTAILDEEDLRKLNSAISEMTDAYTNKICKYDETDCDEDDDGLTIDELEIIMAEETDISELNYYWSQWRRYSGSEVIEEYTDYVKLMNKAARANGFNDAGEMWLQPYVSEGYTAEDFKEEIASLWSELEYFYKLLHGYVRYKLKKEEDFESQFEESEDPIPASILGNMWAQDWSNIYPMVAPFDDELIDISDVLQSQSSPRGMFEIAEEFFTSLGFYSMTEDFRTNSLIVQPSDRDVICHASAWDFFSKTENLPYDGEFRIKMCTDPNQNEFIVIHHEMGHIEYQMSYAMSNFTEKPNPMIYRDGANPGFHEAVGDTIALSVSTPDHLQRIKASLLGEDPPPKGNHTYGQTINFLMKQALSKIAFLPYAYILDQWRWEVFEGKITESGYNKHWWEKRLTYQGLRPPMTRAGRSDFDIGSKYHVLSNVPYIRYFVAHILQFQFHERLCEIAGQSDIEIYNCDIYENKEAGAALKSLLNRGRSEPWQDQLAAFLGTEEGKMNASAILRYFDPLIKYLEDQVRIYAFHIGWPKKNQVLNDYISAGEEISPIVPVIVGIVLCLMVLIVLIAFFVGKSRRKNYSDKASSAGSVTKEAKINTAFEIEEDRRSNENYKKMDDDIDKDIVRKLEEKARKNEVKLDMDGNLAEDKITKLTDSDKVSEKGELSGIAEKVEEKIEIHVNKITEELSEKTTKEDSKAKSEVQKENGDKISKDAT